MPTIHKTVLLNESVNALNLKNDSVVVDTTLGGGGHSKKILETIGEAGKLIAFDQDDEATENFRKEIGDDERVTLITDNFENIKERLAENGIEKVDAILADLGFSSDQLEDAERGISFQTDSPLDMRLDRKNFLTAEKIVNEYSQDEIKRILKEFGDEKYASGIARSICRERIARKIERTSDLVSIIEKSVPGEYRRGKIHFATKTFQAIRIETNRELEVLKKLIQDGLSLLSENGRMAIITFHSGEDRLVKNLLKEYARGCICPPALPICRCGKKEIVKIITKKPIGPSEGEISENPRSRSAKLRVVEKI